MKYFSPSYWFKMWVLSAPLFNDETIGINAKSIDNRKIKDWTSNNTNLQSINQYMTFTNSSTNYQPYTLNQQLPNQNINPFYQTELETSINQHIDEKNRHKRQKEHIINHQIFTDEEYKNMILKVNNEKITVVRKIDEYTTSGNLKAGDIYVGTDNGVYLIHNNGMNINKFDNLDFPIKYIILDLKGSAYIINDKNEIYHLTIDKNWNYRTEEKINVANITEQQFKDIVNKIKNEITVVRKIDEYTKGGNLKAGTIYVGTDNGVYLIHPEGWVGKFDNLNFSIISIILDGKGSAYITNNKNEIYHLNLYGWGSKKINHMESIDLNKELKLYYNDDKSNVPIIELAPHLGDYWNKNFEILNRTSPHMYLWRKQWNWMSSTMLFKQNRIV